MRFQSGDDTVITLDGGTIGLLDGALHGGRHLAHVFVEQGGTRTWVQGHLLSQGLARAYALPGSAACLNEMLARERDARRAEKGLWASPAYALRDAARPDLLLARRGRFEIVEGRVVAATVVP